MMGWVNSSSPSRIYGMLGADGMLDGRRIIGAEMIADATRLRFRGTDAASGRPVAVAAGFQVESPAFVSAPLQSFGHGGWGGSTDFCDPDAKLGFGYVTNSMLAFDDGIDRRRKTLIEAVYDCL
jgi:CubicO group peptidase (beta-lactamase class C family)